MPHRLLLRTLGVMTGLMIGAVSSFGQEPPVATKRQLLQKYVWSTLGVDGAIHATITSGLDQWRESPPEWPIDSKGYAERWASEDAACDLRREIRRGASSIRIPRSHGASARIRTAPCSRARFPFMARKKSGRRVCRVHRSPASWPATSSRPAPGIRRPTARAMDCSTPASA